MAKMKDAKVLSSKLLVDGFKKVVNERIQFTENDIQDWVYLDTPKSIMVVALTLDRQLILVKLYRHNIKLDTYELPAGNVEHEHETTADAAKRELLEETGYTTGSFVDLGRYYVLPSETNRWTHYYLALDVTKVHEPKQDTLIEKYFDMSVHLIPFREVMTIKSATDANITGLESLHGITLAREYLNPL
jgi:ADP-ribose pyrophosphatase